MGKKVESIITDAVIEKVGSEIERLIDKMQKVQKEQEEQKDVQRSIEYCEEKEAIKKEFNRVLEKLKKTDPESDSYHRIAGNLDRLIDILRFWHY